MELHQPCLGRSKPAHRGCVRDGGREEERDSIAKQQASPDVFFCATPVSHLPAQLDSHSLSHDSYDSLPNEWWWWWLLLLLHASLGPCEPCVPPQLTACLALLLSLLEDQNIHTWQLLYVGKHLSPSYLWMSYYLIQKEVCRKLYWCDKSSCRCAMFT